MRKNTDEKGVYAPEYYNAFKCIADKCRHSCCIGWEIYIDSEAYEKYRQTEDILKTVKQTNDGCCFELKEGGRCPHLNERGLCNIILSHGEGYLSEICQNHPRFYNYINDNRIEAGIGIVCEEACRIILENEKPFSLLKIEDIGDEALENSEESNYCALQDRCRIISLIEAEEKSFDERLAEIKSKFAISDIYTPREWLKRFLSLEILGSDWENLLKSAEESFLKTSAETTLKFGKYYERLLVYFVYRHVSVSGGFNNLRARLGFALLSLDVIRSLFENESEQTLERLIELSRRYSAEIEYCEDNTDELIFAFECRLQ